MTKRHSNSSVRLKRGVRRIKNSVFEEYVLKYGEKLSRLCFSLCRNEQDAYDLYQETWLKAFSAYNSDVRDFEKWIYRICVNLFKDTYRKKVRGLQTVQFDSNEHKDAFMASLPANDEYSKDDYSELYSALAKLPEKLKAVVSLKYFSDLSCAEIAEILGITVSAVTTRLSRAIKALAVEMNKERSA